MYVFYCLSALSVNCRIGSLEIVLSALSTVAGVNCRIGSLEKRLKYRRLLLVVNCRIGSLESEPSVYAGCLFR